MNPKKKLCKYIYKGLRLIYWLTDLGNVVVN